MIVFGDLIPHLRAWTENVFLHVQGVALFTGTVILAKLDFVHSHEADYFSQPLYIGIENVAMVLCYSSYSRKIFIVLFSTYY